MHKSSPLRKKTFDEVIDNAEVEMTEIEIEETNKGDLLCQLETRIKQLELIIQLDKNENEKLNLEIEKLKQKNRSENIYGGFTPTVNKKPFKITDHGFKMRYCAIPDGACLTTCLTDHISYTEDEEERKVNNRRVNHHIVDNWSERSACATRAAL